MNKIEFVKYLNEKYEFGNFDISCVWITEGLVNKCFDDTVHRVILKIESRNYDEGFSDIINLSEATYTPEFKGELIALLYKSKYFIDMFAEKSDPLFEIVESSAKYKECIEKYKSNMTETMKRLTGIADIASAKILIDEHMNWVSGKPANLKNVDKIFKEGLIREKSLNEIKRKEKK